MNNKKKILLTSAITIATCLAIITGSTFALFTGGDSFNVAITAGNLKVTAEPVDTDANGIDFVVGSELPGKKPIGSASFSSTTNEIALVKMAPGDYVKFSVAVKNEGDIAVDCTVKFAKKNLTEGVPAEKLNKLWDALEVTVVMVVGGNRTNIFVDKPINSADFTTSEVDMPLKKGESAVFEITIKFPNGDTDGSHDNAYINTNCGITYSVYAEQHNDSSN